MAKQLLRSYLGFAALVAGSALAIGCAEGVTDGFGGAGGSGSSSTKSSASSTKASSSGVTTGSNTTTAATTGSSMGMCGNGICSQDESCQTCPADCTCGAVCGDGTCDASETCDSCPNDCFTGCTSTSSTGSGMVMCHDPCMTGAAMDASCDPGAGFVCMFPAPLGDPSCCTTAWSSNCVSLYDALIGC